VTAEEQLELAKKHLLRDLNDARKSQAYGDLAAPELDAEDRLPNRELRRSRGSIS
jgi:hypothetical protein